MTFDNRVVWITGASSGIGEALAFAASSRGARLVLTARNEEALHRVRADCANPDEHVVVPLDLSQGREIAPVAARVLKRLGNIDILIHNAGVSQRSLAMETRREVDRQILETNYFGAVELTRAVVPSMVERRQGHLVVVTSLVGHIGTPLRSSYAASKHALHGYFDSMRAEVWRYGIRVTLVCPGFINTELPVHALKGDGMPQGTMDRAQLEGLPVEVCADKILWAIQRGKNEVMIGGREKYAVYLERFFPALFRRVIRKVRVT